MDSIELCSQCKKSSQHYLYGTLCEDCWVDSSSMQGLNGQRCKNAYRPVGVGDQHKRIVKGLTPRQVTGSAKIHKG